MGAYCRLVNLPTDPGQAPTRRKEMRRRRRPRTVDSDIDSGPDTHPPSTR